MRKAGLLLALVAMCCACTTVTDYETAVGKTRFTGNVHDKEWTQGLRSVLGKSLTIYNLKEQQYPDDGSSETVEALTSDNLTLTLDASFRWQIIERGKVRELYMEVGNMHATEMFVYNTFRNAIRDAVMEVSAADIMSKDRQTLSKRVQDLMNSRMSPRGVAVTEFFLRNIAPPPSIQNAINEKLVMEQQVQAQRYQTQVVSEQANQRREEAQGIRDAQQIIAASLDGVRGQRYLYWRYLEMLGKIGDGNNNMVIAPTEGGIPLFFGMK